jgi:multidrug resistance efflux pump
VDKDAPLFLMEDRHARFERDKAEAAWKDAQTQLEQAKQVPDQQNVKVAAQGAVIKAKENKRDAAQKDAEEAKRLSEKDLISKEKAAAAAKLVEAADAEIEAEKKVLEGLKLFDPQIGIKRATQDVAAKKIQLDEAQWAVDECTIKAPYKGKVLRLQISVGESLGPNPRQAAILFCSTGPRIIRAEIEQEFAGKVQVGQAARIKDYTTEDAGTWTGKVKTISDWYTHRRSMLLEPLQFNDVRTIECIIDLDAEQKPLKIGQRVRVILPTE